MKKVEQFSIGYALLKVIAYIPFRITHHRFIINGQENIPKNRPIVFAPNHQNALLDPLAIIFATSLQPVFLARADIFKNKWIARILHFLKILPVYRIRDGKETLSKNEDVFNEAFHILDSNKALCLFPEGAHIGIKSMLPHKKAIPRIVFLSAEKSNETLNTQIVPVGINYSNYYGFRRNVTINFGKPLQAKDYYPILKEEGEPAATSKLRDDLFDAVRQLVVNVPDKSGYVLFEEAFKMAPSLNISPNPSRDFVPTEQLIVEKIVQYLNLNQIEKTSWIEKAKEYQLLKNQLKLDEKTLSKTDLDIATKIKNILLITIALPFSIWGTLSNGWLFYLTRYPYRKSIKDPQFYSSVSYVLTLLLFPLWLVVEYFILQTILHSGWLALGLIVLSVPGGILAWETGQLTINFFKKNQCSRLAKNNSGEYNRLKILRTELLIFFQKCMSE